MSEKVFIVSGDICSPQAFSSYELARKHLDLIISVLRARVIDAGYWEHDENVEPPHDIRYSAFLSLPGQVYQHQIFIYELKLDRDTILHDKQGNRQADNGGA